jgi:hypothetical protein
VLNDTVFIKRQRIDEMPIRPENTD